MSFFRRLLGGDARTAPPEAGSPAAAGDEPAVDEPTSHDETEGRRELDLLRAEQARLDELARRQLRYARYAWQPPAQGGDRRADDEQGNATTDR